MPAGFRKWASRHLAEERPVRAIKQELGALARVERRHRRAVVIVDREGECAGGGRGSRDPHGGSGRKPRNGKRGVGKRRLYLIRQRDVHVGGQSCVEALPIAMRHRVDRRVAERPGDRDTKRSTDDVVECAQRSMRRGTAASRDSAG